MRFIYVHIPKDRIKERGDYSERKRPYAIREENGDILVNVGTIEEVQLAIDNYDLLP